MAYWKKVKSVDAFMIDVIKEIEKNSAIVLKEVSEDVRNMLYLYTKGWYENHTPETYNRTYDFINSLTIEFVDDKNVEIGFDSDKLSLGVNRWADGTATGWMQHEDKDNNFSNIIDEGWVAGESNKRIKGSHAIEMTKKYMFSSAFLKEIKMAFRKRGFTVR